MHRAVNERFESNALFDYFSRSGQRIYLKTTAIGEMGFFHELKLCNPPAFAITSNSRTEIQVIGIAQNDLGLDLFFQLFMYTPFTARWCQRA